MFQSMRFTKWNISFHVNTETIQILLESFFNNYKRIGPQIAVVRPNVNPNDNKPFTRFLGTPLLWQRWN